MYLKVKYIDTQIFWKILVTVINKLHRYHTAFHEKFFFAYGGHKVDIF